MSDSLPRCEREGCDQDSDCLLWHFESRRLVGQQHYCHNHAQSAISTCRITERGAGTPYRDGKYISFEIEMIASHRLHELRALYLRECGGHRCLMIMIGYCEAGQIFWTVDGSYSARISTHRLMKDLIASLDGQVERLAITEIVPIEGESHTVYRAAALLATGKGTKVEVAMRPTDAIVLALETNNLLLVSEDVLTAP